MAVRLFVTAALLFFSTCLSFPLLPFIRSTPISATTKTITRVDPSTVPKRDLLTQQLSTTTYTINTGGSGVGGTYPRLTTLRDGSILFGYTQITGKTNTLFVLKSVDAGKTFNPWGQITTTTGKDTDNVFLMQLPNSDSVLAAFRNHDNCSAGGCDFYRITICRSDDGGQTWKFLTQAATSNVRGQGLWEPFMRVGKDGNVQLTFSKELSAQNQETFRSTSADGSTWTTPVNLHVHNDAAEQVRDGMNGIAPITDSADGRDALVMVFETTRRGPGIFNVGYAVSYDDGITWKRGDGVYSPPGIQKNAGSPQIAAVEGKGLVCIFMTDEDVENNAGKWPGDASVKLVVANGLNNGKVSWSKTPVKVQDAVSHWPGLIQVDDKVMAAWGFKGNMVGKFLSWA